MAHIVFVTGGLTGLLNASLALIQQLKQAGHRVTYASPKDLGEPLAAQEIPFVQLAPWGMPQVEQPTSRWHKLRRVRSRQKRAIAALGVEQFTPTLQSLNPDLLLIDIEMHPHIMAAVMAQFPVALLCPFVSIWRRPHVPPIHTKILPGRSWRGSAVGIQLSWLRYGWRKWKETQRDRWQKVGCDRNSVLRRYAGQIGYPTRSFFDLPTGVNQWLVPYPHGSLPILCLHGAELDFPHKPHSTMHYLGLMVAEDLSEDLRSSESSIPLPLTESPDNRPLIYCGCSSMLRTNQSFLRQLIVAARRSPQWEFVLGLGGGSLPDVATTLPTNLHVLQWAPQAQLLERADCAVINAGAQSLAECIHFGVPMLVYPVNVHDQNGNAARVIYHGLGLVGSVEQGTDEGAAQLQSHIQVLLNDVDYRNRVEKMRDRLQHYRQNHTAVRIVENLLDQPKEHLSSTQLPVKMSASRLPGRLASCLQGGRQS